MQAKLHGKIGHGTVTQLRIMAAKPGFASLHVFVKGAHDSIVILHVIAVVGNRV